MAEANKPFSAILSGSAATVYTCTTTTALVTLIQCSNVDTVVRTVTVQRTDHSNSDGVRRLAFGASIPIGESRSLIDGALVLATGDIIQAFCDSASKVELNGSVLEIS